MKQISARQFRTSFPTLSEPVQVAQRRDGELVVLGTWTPQGAKIPYADTWAPVPAGFGSPRPAPKPKAR